MSTVLLNNYVVYCSALLENKLEYDFSTRSFIGEEFHYVVWPYGKNLFAKVAQCSIKLHTVSQPGVIMNLNDHYIQFITWLCRRS